MARNVLSFKKITRRSVFITAIAILTFGTASWLLTAGSRPAQAQDVIVLPKPGADAATALPLYLGTSNAAKVAVADAPAQEVPKPPVQEPMPEPARLVTLPGMQEPLVATAVITAEDDAALDKAIANYSASAKTDAEFIDRAKPMADFVAAYPASPWAMAVHTNLGMGYFRTGYYSLALAAWEQAWKLGRDTKVLEAKRLADRAVGELARMHGRIGRVDELDKLLADVGDRDLTGAATEFVAGAREGSWVMHNQPGIAFLCGPKALANVLEVEKASADQIKVANDAQSGPRGFTLAQLSDLSAKAGMDHRLIYRKPGQPIPVPAIINWKLNHYAAIIGEQAGGYLVRDPTFDSGDHILTQAAIDAEGSGYFLIPVDAAKSPVPPVQGVDPEWRGFTADSDEARSVYGMGFPTGQNTDNTTVDGPRICSSKGKTPMCATSAHLNVVSLTVSDTPVGYRPSKGPKVEVTLIYNHREATQPANFTYFNVGQKWSINWLSYLEDNPASQGAEMRRYPGGGGAVKEYNYHSSGDDAGAYRAELLGGARLKITSWGSSPEYELLFPDGSRHIYGRSDGATTAPRKIFLTQVIDAQGKAVTLTYDGQNRLTTITDADGRNTSFTYGLTAYPLLVTAVTDPFSRSTTLTYDPTTGRLLTITDPINIVSAVVYGTGDFINTLKTAYGNSTFAMGEDTAPPGNSYYRWLEMTDPMTFMERVEFSNTETAIPMSDPPALIPAGMSGISNGFLQYRNTLYWDKHVVAKAGTSDPNNAVIRHWVHDYFAPATSAPIVSSFKLPLENRIWFNYYGQTDTNNYGILNSPLAAGRVLDDGSTKLDVMTYQNASGTDPLNVLYPLASRTDSFRSATNTVGRKTFFDYWTNNVDVKTVKQQIDGAGTLATVASMVYDANHNITSMTDAAGKVWNYAYNTNGQIIYAKNPLNQTRFWEYDCKGRLMRQTVPVVTSGTITYGTVASGAAASSATNAGAATAVSYTYPKSTSGTYAYPGTPGGTCTEATVSPCSGMTAPANTNLPLSITDSEGRKLCYQYDAIDRVTKIKYPDASGTTELFDYNFPSTWTVLKPDGVTPYAGQPSLDLWKYTDRMGRTTTYDYDKNRRLKSKTEQLVGTTTTRTTQYEYYNNGTLKNLIDANGVYTHWDIDIQSRPIQKIYDYCPSATEPNPNPKCRATSTSESYAYDVAGRLKTRTDALGQVKTITYTKDGSPALFTYATVSGQPTMGNVSFTYDDRWPRLTRMNDYSGPLDVNGVGTAAYTDFDYTAIGTAGALQLAGETHSSYHNQHMGYFYDDAGRLSQQWSAESPESFGYDTLGRLSTYSAEISSGNPIYNVTYAYLGNTNQLLSRTTTAGSPTQTLTSSYTYDSNANDRRLLNISHPGAVRSFALGYTFTSGGVSKTDVYNFRTVVESTPSGAMHPLGAQSWRYDYDDSDRLLSAAGSAAGASGVAGTYTMAYDKLDNLSTYRDPRNTADDVPTTNVLNQTTKFAWWQFFTYDANGNTVREYDTGNTTKHAYKWDFEGRLVEIQQPGNLKLTYLYDGLGRRISNVVNNNGTVSSLTRVWCGMRPCQLRNGLDSLRRYTLEGEYDNQNGNKQLYMRDHLGSVRDMVTANNGTRIGTVDYTPYGDRIIPAAGNPVEPHYGFAGLIWDGQAALYTSATRFYDPRTMKWTTRDWKGEEAGENLYGYVRANPIMWTDRLGLDVDVVVNNNDWPFGTHVGIFVSTPGLPEKNVLFDPGGDFRRDEKGSGDALWGKDASLSDFNIFQKMDGPNVSIFHFKTTPEQDEQIRKRIDEGGAFPLQCASRSSEVLSGIGPFKNLGPIRTPAGMADELQKIQESLLPKITPITGR